MLDCTEKEIETKNWEQLRVQEYGDENVRTRRLTKCARDFSTGRGDLQEKNRANDADGTSFLLGFFTKWKGKL